jgi:putative heme degradation protein
MTADVRTTVSSTVLTMALTTDKHTIHEGNGTMVRNGTRMGRNWMGMTEADLRLDLRLFQLLDGFDGFLCFLWMAVLRLR